MTSKFKMEGRLMYLLFLFGVKLSEEVSASTSFNPDVYLSAPQTIKRHGYPAESHIIQTEDGYLLTLHRIPASKELVKGNQPILLQHGLLSSSSDWVNADNRSLAFILADQGYDVWLGNARGNLYSRAHVSISPESATFWNFSWHEMAIYDIPAVINYIAKETGKGGEIIYVGHSMGTTMFFVSSSILEDIASKIKLMVGLAPVAYMTHIRSPIRYLSPWVNDVQFLLKHLGVNEFLPSNKIIKFLAHNCDYSFSKAVCENIIFLICGFDKEQFVEGMLPVIFGHAPAGTSTKTVLHYLQEIAHKGEFRQFDYGEAGNMIKYGQITPPLYNLSNVKVPTYFFYGDNDLLANAIDIEKLAANIKNNIGVNEVPFPNFNHLDFLWGKDAPKLVYDPMIKVLKNYTGFA